MQGAIQLHPDRRNDGGPSPTSGPGKRHEGKDGERRIKPGDNECRTDQRQHIKRRYPDRPIAIDEHAGDHRYADLTDRIDGE